MPNKKVTFDANQESLLASRYSTWLSVFNDKFYFHVKDTRSSLGENKSIRRISFTEDGLKALASSLPDILKTIKKGTAAFITAKVANQAYKRESEELAAIRQEEEEEEEGGPSLIQYMKRRKVEE